MEDRKKFTYRYDNETEKLLNEAFKKYKVTALNKLIDELILEALEKQPKEIQLLKKDLRNLQGKISTVQTEKRQIENQFEQLKLAVKQDFENKERIKKLIS